MADITLSRHTREDGRTSYTVLYGAQSAMAATEDEQHARSYARELFHARGRNRLLEWNGDTAELTLVDQTD